MGFQKRWDLKNIKSQIAYCSAEVNSSYNDGFTAWSCKKELYEIKFYVDSILERSPNFSHLEENFLKDHEQNRLITILRNKSNALL